MRFSILGLLGIVAVIAIGFAALANPTLWWASIVKSGVLFLLAVAIFSGFTLRGRCRIVCSGAAFFGCGYVLLRFVDLPFVDLNRNLLPNRLLVYLEATWNPTNSPSERFYIVECLFALFLSVAGGLIGDYFYALRQKQNAQAAEDMHRAS